MDRAAWPYNAQMVLQKFMLGDNSERDPPDPISNSEVKAFSADDSVEFFHVKVGHCQAPYYKKANPSWGFAFFIGYDIGMLYERNNGSIFFR
jgi:hypothetical protein